MTTRKREKTKEKDFYIRESIMREIIKAKNYIKNIDASAVKDLNDDLDTFYKELEYTEAGHKYPLLSPQKSATTRRIKKVIKYDEKIIEEMENVTESCRQLLDEITKGEDIDIEKEIGAIRTYLAQVRNDFLSRFEVLKGVE